MAELCISLYYLLFIIQFFPQAVTPIHANSYHILYDLLVIGLVHQIWSPLVIRAQFIPYCPAICSLWI